MKIAVCMKQVPAYSDGNMDEKTGMIIRNGLQSITNIYDISALECALRIKEKVGAEITIFTMGPNTAENVIREAYAMGADKGYLICDSAFAGSDVLSTSYTLMQSIKSTGEYDLILCGKQTTDGDTAQVSGALAQWFDIPHINWVSNVIDVTENEISVTYTMKEDEISAKVAYPCILSVEKELFLPRMPSLKLKMAGKKKPVFIISLNMLEDRNAKHYGLKGSATKVVRIFLPEYTSKHQFAVMEGKEAAHNIWKLLKQMNMTGSAAK